LRIFWPQNDLAPLLRWRRHYALQFLSEFGSWRLVETTGNVRISVVVQQFNSLLLHDGFVGDDRPE